MASLTKRERVMRTVRFEETDRPPIYDLLQADAVIEHYTGQKITYENGDRLQRLAIGRTMDMTRALGGPVQPHTTREQNGIVLQRERWTSWIIETPFDDIPSLVEWVKGEIARCNAQHYDRAYAEQMHSFVRDAMATFSDADPTGRRDPTVFVLESLVGLTHMYWEAGLERFGILMYDAPDLVEEGLEARLQAELRRVAAIADPYLVPIVLTADDIAFKTSLLFSPKWLRRYFFPRLARLNAAWHDRDTICLFHSDGNLWPVLDDLVAAGIDGLNPLEVLAGMNVGEVRRRYPHLFLAGGIDVSQLLALGTPDEVRLACRQAIADTGGRGYFLGSTRELHWGVKLENVIAMFETAYEMSGESVGPM